MHDKRCSYLDWVWETFPMLFRMWMELFMVVTIIAQCGAWQVAKWRRVDRCAGAQLSALSVHPYPAFGWMILLFILYCLPHSILFLSFLGAHDCNRWLPFLEAFIALLHQLFAPPLLVEIGTTAFLVHYKTWNNVVDPCVSPHHRK